MTRKALLAFLTVAPACIFFWWAFQGCRFPSLSAVGADAGVPDWGRPLWNAALFCLFGFLHSAFAQVEMPRLPYVLFAGASSFAVMFLWQPLAENLWELSSPQFAWWFSAIQFCLWLAGHAWAAHQIGMGPFFGWSSGSLGLVTSGPYRYLRHPMHFSILLNLLITPVMTADRLTLLLAVTFYLAVAIPIEEQRLEEEFGQRWEEYRRRVPALFPRMWV